MDIEKTKKEIKDYCSELLADAEDELLRITKLLDELDGIPARIEAARDKAADAADESYRAAKEVHASLVRKIEDFDKIPEFRVPYGIHQLLEIAPKVRDLTDEQWNRLKELAVAMKSEVA